MIRTIFLLTVLLFATGHAQDTWEQKLPMNSPTARYYHAMANIGGDNVLMFGGGLSDDVTLAPGTWVYNLSTNTWTDKNPTGAVPAPRIFHAMAYLGDDKVLLYGGMIGVDTYENGTWVYDLSANTWTEMNPPGGTPSAEYGMSLAYIGDDKAVLFGGMETTTWSFQAETWVYDLSENSWSQKSPVTTPSITGMGAPFVFAGGDQALLYGNSPTLTDYSGIWMYDLSADQWQLKIESSSPEASFATAMAPLPGSDKALLFGGYGTMTWSGMGTRVYDQSDDAWTTIYPTTEPYNREYHAMASIGTGKVLLFGGIHYSSYGSVHYGDTWVYTATQAVSYAINATAGTGGSISPSGTVIVNQGDDQAFTFSPASGYQLAGLTVDGSPIANPTSPYIFTNVTADHSIAVQFAPLTGSIAGMVRVSNSGVGGITVKLLDGNGNPVAGINPVVTGGSGSYAFPALVPASYQVMIVEPLGYLVDQNPKFVMLQAGTPHTLDFDLTPIVASNAARGLGYWKHQFDVQVTAQGHAQETAAQLNGYISAVHSRYTPHYTIFTGVTTFSGWQGILTVNGNQPMAVRAKAHLAALLMNLMSLKVAQTATATLDGRSVADVLSYVSDLLSDNSTTNDALAKNLAESVNQQQLIGAGIVPPGSIVYKQNHGAPVRDARAPLTLSLEQNYPNPFNPSTVIRYTIPENGHVALSVFDAAGGHVTELVNAEMERGTHGVVFNAAGLPSGVYMYRIQSGGRMLTGTMSLMK